MVAVELECSKKQLKLFYNAWFLYSRRHNKLSRRQEIVEPRSKTLIRQIVLQATCILCADCQHGTRCNQQIIMLPYS